jgi:Cu+-exporting ATPase
MSTHQISFAIRGMYCAKCAVKIQATLAQLDGIIAAQVNYASERASVVYDPARVHMAAMIDAVRSMGFDTTLERRTLTVRDLIYASSAHTVERIMHRAEGVVDASVDLRAGRVTLTTLPEHASRDSFQVLLTWLGFPSAVGSRPNSPAGFVVRGLLVIGAAILLMIGTLNHLGIFAVATELPSPFWLIALAAFTLVGAGEPFYLRAFAVLMRGEFDASVLIAFVTSATFFGGLVLVLITGDTQAVPAWSGWGALVLAAILTAGWFIARALALWVWPRFRHTVPSNNLAAMTAPQSQVTSESTQPDAMTGSVFARH